MGYFNVDPSFATHPKVKALRGNSQAIACWLMLGSACSQGRTAGHVTPQMLDEVLHHMTTTARRAAALALVKVGLWEITSDGWQFHDWKDYQPMH